MAAAPHRPAVFLVEPELELSLVPTCGVPIATVKEIGVAAAVRWRVQGSCEVARARQLCRAGEDGPSSASASVIVPMKSSAERVSWSCAAALIVTFGTRAGRAAGFGRRTHPALDDQLTLQSGRAVVSGRKTLATC